MSLAGVASAETSLPDVSTVMTVGGRAALGLLSMAVEELVSIFLIIEYGKDGICVVVIRQTTLELEKTVIRDNCVRGPVEFESETKRP